MIDDVLGYGPPIRPFRWCSHREYAGLEIATRSPRGSALVSIWSSYLFIYDLPRLDYKARANAVANNEQILARSCADLTTIFRGLFQANEHSATLTFDSGSHPAPEDELTGLLCRAFGYRDLHPDAKHLYDCDPLIRLNSARSSLGTLSRLIASAYARYASKRSK
jgi:hypothetical protein